MSILADTKMAIELEEKGYEFYVKTAGKTNNPLASSTLKSLAERELVHIDKIKEFYGSITGENKLPADWIKKAGFSPKREELLKPILLKLSKSLDKKFEKEEDTNEAYMIAEGLERDSYNLYDRMSKEGKDEVTVKFFAALAQEEREHFAILDETLQYLNRPGDWFREKERWIVEG